MRGKLAILCCLPLLLLLSISFSQDEVTKNLLENGDFEGDFVELEGPQPRYVAAGWTPWHAPAAVGSPAFANNDPYYDQELEQTYLGEAGKAQVYFTEYATHQAGIYQRVTGLERGTTYRFSIYGHVWSSKFNNPADSEQPGNVGLRVGIDPNGGTNGSGKDIIWSTGAAFFYDAYRPYSVIATAQSSAITVFVESTVGEPQANNYIYLDNAVLEVASETVVIIEPTPTSEKDADLGSPPTEVEAPIATLLPIETESPSEEETSPTAMPNPTMTATPSPTAMPSPTATPTQALSPTPTAGTEAEAEEEPASEEFPDTVLHVVVEEDTVSALAYQYDSTVAAINKANELNARNLIYVGQELIIPINLPADADRLATVEPSPTPTFTPTFTPTPTPTFTPIPTPTPISYQILPGDTLETIGLRHGVNAQDIAALNGIFNPDRIDVGVILLIPTLTPSPTATSTPMPTPTPFFRTRTSSITYVVQTGDLLGDIAAAHDTTTAAIIELNDLANPSRIYAGQELQIPVLIVYEGDPPPTFTPTLTPTMTPFPTSVPTFHTVQAGETLIRIAGYYGVSIIELAQRNNLSNFNELEVGQVLSIPG